MSGSEGRRRLAALGYRGLLGLTALTDALPSRLRFGHWQSALALMRPPAELASVPRHAAPPEAPKGVAPRPAGGATLSCMLVAGALDGGGVEQVISALALGLPAQGFEVEVVTDRSGRVGRELQEAGARVSVCPSDGLAGLIAEHRPDVIELHRPDPGLVRAVAAAASPVIPVFHAVESYLDRAAVVGLGELARAAPSCIAVSSGVGRFFAGLTGGARITVVVNGVATAGADRAPGRTAARRAVSEAIGTRIDDGDILVVALQRYSDQKNAAGLVDAFLAAAGQDPRLRLVIAGSPDNWLEYRRADLLRRGSPRGHRVHLLGDSDAGTILAAGDVYALDSFAEGGPLSAVEAALHGLPLVLSDVGFGRDLAGSPGVVGEVVERPGAGQAQIDLARARRRLHQSNRDPFAAALVRAATCGRGRAGRIPSPFTEEEMVAGHAAVLRAALP
ncbi:glycosyltransferase [Acidipropionibacterium virtanenii]|uniref:Glycosyltransferase Gtf1 n=1 Tax=Acidipropionibacterium virtanenii TaxID=2057246 RepID=A0A344UTU4_9ACTN|nr:glycosyltransferase [Acidipropionibacterium virtanenii]AXE38692.1 Glycosyltransferase Gtf1 [Acidipropionibacterium virtanenii]